MFPTSAMSLSVQVQQKKRRRSVSPLSTPTTVRNTSQPDDNTTLLLDSTNHGKTASTSSSSSKPKAGKTGNRVQQQCGRRLRRGGLCTARADDVEFHASTNSYVCRSCRGTASMELATASYATTPRSDNKNRVLAVGLGEATTDSEEEEHVLYQLLDIDGMLVPTTSTEPFVLPVSQLPDGVYQHHNTLTTLLLQQSSASSGTMTEAKSATDEPETGALPFSCCVWCCNVCHLLQILPGRSASRRPVALWPTELPSWSATARSWVCCKMHVTKACVCGRSCAKRASALCSAIRSKWPLCIWLHVGMQQTIVFPTAVSSVLFVCRWSIIQGRRHSSRSTSSVCATTTKSTLRMTEQLPSKRWLPFISAGGSITRPIAHNQS